ncbi:hypothetical protein PSN45_004371 [Yamadazyma tenuis]|uniref:uncharacterized protein n=1 Tax=Candida tenuis TaxID=2315449 RepID=UPI0027A16115|nr:hypothetical protein PSN45_004371 [Yamadazyma tenuis]
MQSDLVPGISFVDCKILQYKYAIYKIKHLLPFLAELLSSSSANKLRLCNYLTLLSGNVFAINEGLFNSKLEAVSNFKLFKVSPINISPIVSHIPYDSNDVNINPMIDIPSTATSAKCTKLLETLYNHCLQGYEKRLAQALSELPDYDASKYDKIIEATFTDKDLDLVGSSELLFDITKDENLLKDNTFVEATLIDIDIRMIFVIIENYKQALSNLKVTISKFKGLKSNLTKLNSIQDWELSLHKIMLLTLRLNDMYIILRRFGRKIYLSNFQHLNDQKFLMSSPNSNFLKFTVLKNIDEVFNQTKKNGVLIANLTRLLRQNSKFEVNVKNVLDFNNFASQGHFLLESSLIKFEEFGRNWIAAELRFRRINNLPKFYLTETANSVEKNTNSKAESSTDDAASIEKKMKKLAVDDNSSTSTKEKSIFNRPSRSSSVSSNNSTASASSITRMATVNSFNRNSVIIPKTTTSPRSQRPNSMIFLSPTANGSANSLPVRAGSITSLTAPSANSAANGRRRSNSQPQSSPEHLSVINNYPSPSTSPLSSRIASSGAAAAALKQKGLSPTPVRRTSISRKPVTPTKQSVIAEETYSTPPTKLSANQRLQNHLKEAARNGSLMTQEKEILTSVVFDPNLPSSVNIRRYAEREEIASTEVSVSSPVPIETLDPASVDVKTAPLKRKTRDEVTKMNTKRNSQVVNVSSNTSVSSSTAKSSEISSSTDRAFETIVASPMEESDSFNKKVRFTGVPAYSEAEDAPTKYSARILKNFAVFKTPSTKGFRKKDQMLKKEESILFKSQLHPDQAQTGPQAFLSNSLQNTKFKLKSKLT